MFSNLLGRNSKSRKNSNKHSWELLNCHKTWRIRNQPININNKYILYSTDFNVGENGMVMYDIKHNTFDITRYPQSIAPEFHSYCKYKDEIYIINTDGRIITFNLKKKSFKHITNIKNRVPIGRYSTSINIAGSDIIHIFGGLQNEYHLIYYITKKKYSQKTNFGAKLENPSVLYCSSTKELIMFCGYASKSIFIGSMISDDEVEWKASKHLRIPNNLRECGQMLYKKHIIIFGGCGANKLYSNDIYTINIQNETQDNYNKLERVVCPTKNLYHVILVNDKIHLFGLWNSVKHHTMSIDVFNDILPQIQDDDDDNDVIDGITLNDEEKQSFVIDTEVVNGLKKEIQIKDNIILELKKENKELKEKLLEYQDEHKLDESNYREWDAETVVLWISAIDNDLYNEYKTELLQHLDEDGVIGNDLEDINNHEDWKKYGIKMRGDRKKLMQYVDHLIQKQRKLNIIQDQDNEGKVNHTQYIDR